MGDMADDDMERGWDMWLAHQDGACLEDCVYCEEGYDGPKT